MAAILAEPEIAGLGVWGRHALAGARLPLGFFRATFSCLKNPRRLRRGSSHLDVLTAYGAPELTPLYCKADDWLAEALSAAISWERTKTLGRGDDVCNSAGAAQHQSDPAYGSWLWGDDYQGGEEQRR